MAKSSAATRPAATRRTRLLVATRKGLWTLTSDVARNGWRLAGPQFLGHTIHHAVVDPRDGKTILAAARTGHLGPTVFRSQDGGRTWKEAATPPAFAPEIIMTGFSVVSVNETGTTSDFGFSADC